ncbi:beta-ketoacyl synthase N-terminal-like domain-containing protein [Streptomyces sp. NPDC047976]|uniref:beta-ketoacyl synthase N-terminal-like domain-containing protein n=1 Tax=Streptomyces sp. NPDC047976 TaxID=3155746 RepID=UPI0034397B6D
MSRRAVITGIGVRTPGGNGRKEFWDLLTAGRTATRRISFFDASGFRSQVAGEADFDAAAEGLTPDEIRRADGAGVPHLDAAEAGALTALFGPRGVPVTVPKALTGRLYGGGGPLDVATALLALRDGVVPPTHGLSGPPEAYGIDLVRGEARELPLRHALVLARGRHGFNSAVVLTASDG